MDADAAIRRLSFAEAQHSSAEAMITIARERARLADISPIEADARIAELGDRAADAARHLVDKTA